MYQELEQVVRYLPPGCEVVAGKRADVVAMLRRGERRGELAVLAGGVYPLGVTGQVYAPIRRLRAPAPAWRKPALWTAGTLTAVGVAAWVVWTVVSALATVAGMATVTGVLLTMMLVRRGRSAGMVVEVVQRVTVRR